MNHNLRARNKLWRLLSQLPSSLQCRRRGPKARQSRCGGCRYPRRNRPSWGGRYIIRLGGRRRMPPAVGTKPSHQWLYFMSLKSGVIGENPAISEPTRPGRSSTLIYFCANVVKPFVFRRKEPSSGYYYQDGGGPPAGEDDDEVADDSYFEEFASAADEFLRQYQGYTVDFVVAVWK